MTDQKFNDVEPLFMDNFAVGLDPKEDGCCAVLSVDAHTVNIGAEEAEALYAWLGKALGKV